MPLHPLPEKREPDLGQDNPTVYCEQCGATGKTHTMYGFLISFGVTGHPFVPGFTCGASQGERAHNHWSCPTEECFVQVLSACAREHLHPTAQERKEQMNVIHSHEI
jgi:hypothetical protein